MTTRNITIEFKNPFKKECNWQSYKIACERLLGRATEGTILDRKTEQYVLYECYQAKLSPSQGVAHMQMVLN